MRHRPRRLNRRTSRRVRRRRRPGRRFRRGAGGAARKGAESRLSQFRQATIVSVALTGLLLLLLAPDEAGVAQDAPPAVAADSAGLPDTVSIVEQVPLEELRQDTQTAATPDSLAREGTEEATETLGQIWLDFYALLPKLGIALGILVLAWLLTRLLRPLLHRGLRSWRRGNAATALVSVAVWLLAVGVALSVLTGDFRALVGSLGLVGLALSWALQTPIESFTGWLLNSFQGYYRVGDRIAVGDVYGDVYRIDVLTTTVWEYGGPERMGMYVHGEQPTGRLITFPNNEILTGYVVNITRDFPYVWDELRLEFSTDSDVDYLLGLMRRIAREVLGDHMQGPAREYGKVLRREGLETWTSEEPQVYVGVSDDQWLQVTVRYLVGARERRKWKSALVERAMKELQTPESQKSVKGAYDRRLVQFLDERGRTAGVPWDDGTGGGP